MGFNAAMVACLVFGAFFVGVITQNSKGYPECKEECKPEPGENRSTCGAKIRDAKGSGSYFLFRNECEVKCMEYTVHPKTVCCNPKWGFDENCNYVAHLKKNDTKSNAGGKNGG